MFILSKFTTIKFAVSLPRVLVLTNSIICLNRVILNYNNKILTSIFFQFILTTQQNFHKFFKFLNFS